MPRQHFIPAAYIGSFSFGKLRRSRERVVWVKRRGISNPYKKKAKDVAYKINIYSERVDELWSPVEKNLIKAIDELVASDKNKLSVEMWVILVQFIAQLFVRGYEFDLRFQDRMNKIFSGNSLNEYIDINGSRLMELQRLYAPVMYADWMVLHNTTNKAIITNDLGFGLMADNTKEKYGYMFPLSKKSVLVLMAGERTNRKIAPVEFRKKKWNVVDIIHKEIDEYNIDNLNIALSEFCLNEIYGSTQKSVDYNLLENRPVEFGTTPDFLIPDDNNYFRDCEMDLYKLISIIQKEKGSGIFSQIT